MITITIKEYADFRGISPQAVSKKICRNKKDGLPLHSFLPYLEMIESFQRSYKLYFKGKRDAEGKLIFNNKKQTS